MTIDNQKMNIDKSLEEPLISLAKYHKSGNAPVDMYHLLFYNRDSLEENGVIVRYGRKWLVSVNALYRWLRLFGKSAGN